MEKLREQMAVDLQLSGAKPLTQKIYLREVDNLEKYFNRSPAELGEADLKEYLLYLMKERHLSEGTFRFYVAALKFFYRTTLKREWMVEKIRHPRAKRKLPIVLDLSEVESLFAVTKNLKHKAILMLTYSSGLRASETARLKITDIDSKRMMVRINQGKGGKDRYSLLSQTALEHLRQYWRKYRPTEWLFNGAKKKGHLSTNSIQQLFYQAKRKAGITKPASVHTLRHSFATHLIEAGTSLHHVQLLLGHRSPTTTTVYLHVSRLNLAQVTSPLDRAAPRFRNPENGCEPLVGWRWRISSVNTARLIDNPIGCPAIIGGSCGPLRSAEPLPWAAIRISATNAVIWKYPITPAGTGTAPSARPYGKKNGSRLAGKTSCPLNTSMWSSPSPPNLIPWF